MRCAKTILRSAMRISRRVMRISRRVMRISRRARSHNIDRRITENSDNLFGNIDAYRAAFPRGLAGAYRDYMSNTIQAQINDPPQYLTDLWNLIMGNIQNAAYLPDVFDEYFD